MTILVLALAAGTLACGEKTAGGGAPVSRGTAPGMAKFRIGPAAGSDGIVTVETDSFHQGDSVKISYEVKNVPPKSQTKVVWSDSSKAKISEEQKAISADTGSVNFEMKGAKDLPTGQYIVEFFYEDPQISGKWIFLGSKNFQVGMKRTSRDLLPRNDLRA